MAIARAEKIFRALSDRTRLRILNLLRDGEMCVGDLVEILQVPQPTASRHLAYLRRFELVEVRKNGQWAFYRLAADREATHRRVLQVITPQLDDDAEFAADLERAATLRREGGCCPGEVNCSDS
jgi:ArsR family transcriptional regulator